MDGHTCIACRLVFSSVDQQKEHYRTAWHCFNLKRKVANLAPLSEEVFTAKLTEMKDKKGQETNNKGGRNNHVNQQAGKKQHKNKKTKGRNQGTVNLSLIAEEADKAKKLEAQKENETNEIDEDGKVEGDDTEKTEEDYIQERLKNAKSVPVTESLFDGFVSESLESNLERMREEHGFFVPGIEYLNDLEGLVSYLGEKVGIGFCCLWCAREYLSLNAVRSHMIDKSHCKMSFTGAEEEYSEFYDMSKLGFDLSTPTQAPGTEIVPVTEEGMEIVSYNQRNNGISESQVTGELILKDGASLGHRSLNRYYRQKAKVEDSRASMVIGKLQAQYKELGLANWREQREKNKSELKRDVIREQQKQYMQVGVKANKFQKHFRAQCDQ